MPLGRTIANDAAPDLARIGNAINAKEMKPLKKNLYKPHEDVESMSKADVVAWQQERDIAVEGSSLRPIQQFSHTGVLPQTPS